VQPLIDLAEDPTRIDLINKGGNVLKCAFIGDIVMNVIVSLSTLMVYAMI
jgi:hypothetical protein